MSPPETGDGHAPRRPLYLHIGHPKVASSTIQVALSRNVEALRCDGYLVSDAELAFPDEGALRGAPVHYVADMCERREDGLRDAVERFKAIDARLGTTPRRLVVSAESFCIPGAEFLAKALRHAFEIHVIYYIRRQDDWLVSAWNQWGCQEGLGLHEYCDRQLAAPHPNFARVLSRWQPVADSLRVRPLHDEALIGGDIVEDFFAAIGSGVTPNSPPRANTTTDLALLEVFRDSPFLFESIHDGALRDWLRPRIREDFPIEKAILGPNMVERIRGTFDEQNRALHAAHFPDVDFDAVFGPGPDDDDLELRHHRQNSVEAALTRIRRVLGLQFDLLASLSRRLD